MKKSKRSIGMLLSIAVSVVLMAPTAVSAAAGGIAIEAVKSEVTYEAGEKKSIQLEVTNSSPNKIDNVKVAFVESEKPQALLIEEGDKVQTPEGGSIEPGKSVKVSFPFAAAADVKKEVFDLKFSITYDGGAPIEKVVKVGTQEKIPVPEKGDKGDKGDKGEPGEPGYSGESAPGNQSVPDVMPANSGGEQGGSGSGSGGTTSVPRVIVTGFTTDPAVVKAGMNFTLNIAVQNTSKKTAVSNMLFDLSAPNEGEADTSGPAFLPASGSSSIYLNSIPAGGTKNISIALNARGDLVQKPYSIQVSMKYEDKNGTQHEGTSSVSIPVTQDARFEFSEIEVSPGSIAVGDEGNAMCSLYNLGRTKLYNVKAKFEGEDITAKEIFVGHVESGATASIDGMIVGAKESAGEGKVKMIMSYEDASGNVFTSEKEFVLMVTPVMEEDMMGGAMEVTTEKKTPIIPIIVAVVVLIAVIVTVIVLKKKKKRAQAVEEEGLIDEIDRLT